MTQMMKRSKRRSLRTLQTVSRKRIKLDPDDSLLEGKSVAKPGHQTATHCSNYSILCEQSFDYIFSLRWCEVYVDLIYMLQPDIQKKSVKCI